MIKTFPQTQRKITDQGKKGTKIKRNTLAKEFHFNNF